MRPILLCIFTMLLSFGRAQGISGEWYGWANVNDILDTDNYMLALRLSTRGESVHGSISLYYMDEFREFPIDGVYDTKTGSFLITDIEIPRHFENMPALKKLEMDMYLTGRLVYSRKSAQLKGELVSKDYSGIKNINFVLVRPSVIEAPNSGDYQVTLSQIPRAAQPARKPPYPRRTIVTHEIEVTSDTVDLTFYDGAIIDHDTVSVYYNDERIIDRLDLDDNGHRHRLALDRSSPSHTLVLHADNLGTIPPNTGVLVIYVDSKRYELFFNNSLDVSTGIKFWRKH